MKRAFQIAFLREQGLQPDHRLIDVGCGTLRGGIPIIEYLAPGHYLGIDSRADVIAEAEKELREAGLEHRSPRLVASDRLTRVEVDHAADFIWAFSVLIHMDDPHLEDCFSFARDAVRDDGVFLANVAVGPAREVRRWKEFPAVRRPLEEYRRVAATHGFSLQDLGRLDDLGHRSGDEAQDSNRMLAMRIDR
jgi:cyclopropane fatty-acyl-phospholipid synthase-like methyltransferase